ncbi:MAG: 1-acyl-sn-glycerol-3-phosphate acyltransferase [Mycobacteriales bacterium]
MSGSDPALPEGDGGALWAGARLAVIDPVATRFARGSTLMTVTRLTARALGRALGRVEVIGADRVPPSGGLLLAANHLAFVDGPLLYGVLRRPAVFLTKVEVFRGIFGSTLRRIGQIPVRRGSAERAPLQAALATLAAGGVVGVFPEGGRGNGAVEQMQHGVAYLALRSGCPVVPVACHGTAALFRRRTLRRPPVRVAFGDPINLPDERRASRRMIAVAAEDIRAALAAHVAATRPAPPEPPV